MEFILRLLKLAAGLIFFGLLLYAAFVIGIIVLAIAVGFGIIGFLSMLAFGHWQLWQAKRHGDMGESRIIEADYIEIHRKD